MDIVRSIMDMENPRISFDSFDMTKGKLEVTQIRITCLYIYTNAEMRWLFNIFQCAIIYDAIALCPNCHRKMHILEMQEDIERLEK